MEVGSQAHIPAVMPQGKWPGTRYVEGWVGLKVALDRCKKSRPPPGFDPQTVQPVASRYTLYAIPTQDNVMNQFIYSEAIPRLSSHCRSFSTSNGIW